VLDPLFILHNFSKFVVTVIKSSAKPSSAMSHEARPISPVRFASALEDLPLANLYSKAFEIRNSIAHLQRSNEELQAYSDSQHGGDTDCLEAIRENEVVIERMRERVGLLKREVEKRGGRWHEADAEVDGVSREEGDGEVTENGHASGVMDGEQGLNGEAIQESETSRAEHPGRADGDGPREAGGRLNDEELRRRMLERMDENDEDGMHL
jgi:hypothetical protein